MPVADVSSTKVVPSTTGVPTRKSVEISLFLTAAVLVQSVERVDCRAGGRGFDSWGWTNTQGLKITEK